MSERDIERATLIDFVCTISQRRRFCSGKRVVIRCNLLRVLMLITQLQHKITPETADERLRGLSNVHYKSK